MTCPDDDQLALHVEGALPTDERAEVAAHLLECGACRSLVAALAAARTRTRHSTQSTVFPASTWRWQPGRRIGRFVLQGPLGRGGMGEVYEALDTELGRTVAIKVARSGAQDERVVREGQALAKLDHPNVIPVFDAGTHEGAAYIVLARAPGSSLRRWSSVESRSVREVLELFRGVARGCAAMHALGLVHRDIKPDNILVGEDGRGMLSDFGLASPTRPGSGGTPGYIAPEVERGEEATEASDQYGFCVTLDEALRDARGRVPRGVRAVIQRGRRPNPAERFGSMDALVHALEPRTSTSRAAAAVLGSIAVVSLLVRPPADTCPWKDEPWPSSDDSTWNRLQRDWVTVATETCPASDRVRTCLLQQRHDAAVMLDAAEGSGATERPWANLDPASCLQASAEDGQGNAARERIAAAIAARLEGHIHEATRLADEALKLAQATGEPALIAEALAESGTLAGLRTDLGLASEQLIAAHWMALRSDALDVAADTAIELVDILSLDDRFEEAKRWRHNALAALDRLGAPDPFRRAQLEVVTSLLHQRFHDFPEAVAAAQRALDWAEQLDPPPEWMLVSIDSRIGSAMQVAGDTAGAKTHLERALERQLKLRGEDHPATATILFDLGVLHASNLPEPERAVELFRRSLAIVDGPDAEPTYLAAKANLDLANTLIYLNAYEEARGPVDRAGVLFDALLPEEHPRRLGLFTIRANLAQAEGRTEEAWQLAEEGMLMANRTLGGRAALTGSMTATAGELAYNQGKYAVALQRFETALSIFEEVAGPKHPLLSEVLIRMGDAELHLDHHAQAFTHYERAMTIELPGDARTRALLGLARTASDPADTARYAQQALDTDPDVEAEVAEILKRKRR